MKAEKLRGKIKKIDFRPSVLAEQVSQILTEAILEGALTGGDQLTEAELQKQFGISRSPLREAFRSLEKQGLVDIVPRKGTFVKHVTRRDVEENFPVRAVLEGLAAQEAGQKMTAKTVEAMKEALDTMASAVKRNHTMAYWRGHLKFHDIFIKASGNEILITILKTLRMHSLWYRFSYQYYREDLKSALRVHQKIFDLFQHQDTGKQRIRHMVEKHIQTGYHRFLAYLDEQTIQPSVKKDDLNG